MPITWNNIKESIEETFAVLNKSESKGKERIGKRAQSKRERKLQRLQKMKEIKEEQDYKNK